MAELAVFLAAATKDCADHDLIPSREPSVMLISYQISFAGNGDFPMGAFYRDLLDYCKKNVDEENVVTKDFELPYGVT